jgi:hypothetical protein
MAKYDVKVVKAGGAQEIELDVAASATLIYPGEPVKKTTNYAVKLATGDPEIGTDEMIGIATSTSTNDASNAGKVRVMVVVPGKTILRCKAHTATNVNTAAKLLGLMLDCVCFDLTGTTFTVNEDEGDDPNVHGLQIIGGDINKGTLDFIVQGPVALGNGHV